MSDYNIKKRHELLERSIGVKTEEEDSFSSSNTLMITVTVCMIVFSALEIGLYLLYNRVVIKYFLYIYLQINYAFAFSFILG